MNPLWLVVAMTVSKSAPSKPFPMQFFTEVSGSRVTVCLDGRKIERTVAGKMGFKDSTRQWMSVCADVRAPIRLGQTVWARAWHTSSLGGNVKKAGNIVAKYFKAATTSDQCAGLQLAVWEAIEDGSKTPDFSSGRFQAKASQDVIRFASHYYQAIETNGEAIFLQTQPGNGQSQVAPIN